VDRLHDRALLREVLVGDRWSETIGTIRGGPVGAPRLGVPLGPGVLRGVEQHDAVAGVPAAERGGALGVVGEQEVVDRVLLAAATAVEVGLHPDVDALGVGAGTRLPGVTGEDLHSARR
jgi:hypothetical protein